MKTINGKNYMTAKEAAEKIGITPEHVRLLARQGTMPSIRQLGRIYFDPGVVDTVERGNRLKTGSVLD